VREQGVAAARANAAGVIPPLAFVASTTSEEEAKAKVGDVITSEADDRRLAAAAASYQAQNPGVTFVQALQHVSKGVN
jgi:hypothetical protein